MNIFEFLGLPSDHRTGDKVVQLVKHFNEVNPKADDGILHKNVSFPMYLQCKKDGNFAAVVVNDGFVGIFNRRGSHFSSVSRLECDVLDQDLPDGVYFAELFSPICSLEELSGVVNPNRVNLLDERQREIMNSLQLFFFDQVGIRSFIRGDSNITFSLRYSFLLVALKGTDLDWLDVQIVESYEDALRLKDFFVEAGQEGVVLKQDVGWLAGAKDWHQMKLVRDISFDLLCIGYEEGKGKYAGKVANLLFKYKGGKTVKAMLGKGWTHDKAEEMYQAITLNQHMLSPVGQIFQVYALQESSKGILRLPKVGELRHDKTKPDFS